MGVVKEAGTDCHSRASAFNPGLIFGGVCVVFLFLRLVYCVPGVASFSGSSILDCSFGFS